MIQTRSLVVLAGAALGLGTAALAQSSDQTRALSSELRSDAANRTSLLAQADSEIALGGQIQFRYIWNFRDEAPNAVEDDPATPGVDETVEDEDTTLGFQARRTKIWAKGNVAEDWGFKIVGAFDRDGGDFELEDAFINYDINDTTSVMFGQFKLPFLREELVSSAKQLAVDRSVTNETFNQDRSQGIMVTYTGDAFRFGGAFSDGLRTANTDFDSMAEADYAFTGRVEWKWAGDWEVFEDFTSWQGSDYAGMIGGALHWEDGGSTGGPTAEVETFGLTVDASAEGNGWNAYGAFIWLDEDSAFGESTSNYGWLVQGGVFLAERWELFGRFDMTIPDDDLDADEFSTITVGVNHYVIPESHAVKFTADVQYLIDELDKSIVSSSTGVGILPDTGDGQWAIRLQMQLVF